MIRTYKILSINKELLTSPYINKLKEDFDIVLTVDEPKIINFLFQVGISRSETHQVYAVYEEDSIELNSLFVECFSHQTLLTANITTKDIGALRLSFVVPDHLALSGASSDTITAGY